MAAKPSSKRAKPKKLANETKSAKTKPVGIKNGGLKSKSKLSAEKAKFNSVATKISEKIKTVKPAQVKHGFKFVFKWIAITAIVFFFVGGPVLAAWMSNKDAQQKRKEQEEFQKQIEEYQKKTQQEAEKPKEYDESLKFGEITNLEVIDEKTGDGAAIKEGDQFKAKYKLALSSTGEVIEEGELDLDNYGNPYKLQKPNLIDGWVEGMVGMKAGGVRSLKVPSDKGYGEAGQGQKIGPNTDLSFRIELTEVIPSQ
jgi:FKBP-type peptidyl-prolyl cis-trans isomerase